ncbi:MAG TPA: hypothetical protein VLQ80_07870 [Candidatus Saccharimonadia bacterium]|nr:hypothetical protein [Candidatus Saccharimonadia bacterium]
MSDAAIEHSIGLYQPMLAARPQDPAQLVEAYRDSSSLVLTIDGVQPAKGHETWSVVRERMRKRGWFAESLLSRATPEVRRLIVVARQWAERRDKPVRGWMSEKQDAFVKAIASEFPGTPHRYCSNHFLRDVAQPVLERDSRAKVKMRRKVRGLRALERRVLEAHRPAAAPEPTPSDERAKTAAPPLGGGGALDAERLRLAHDGERRGGDGWGHDGGSARDRRGGRGRARGLCSGAG